MKGWQWEKDTLIWIQLLFSVINLDLICNLCPCVSQNEMLLLRQAEQISSVTSKWSFIGTFTISFLSIIRANNILFILVNPSKKKYLCLSPWQKPGSCSVIFRIYCSVIWLFNKWHIVNIYLFLKKIRFKFWMKCFHKYFNHVNIILIE